MSCSAQDDELSRLLLQAQSGDVAALDRIAALYGPHLLRVVRRNLPRRLRTAFDSQDFVQAAWATFIRTEVDLNRFSTARELFAYLSGVASHKVTEQVRKRLLAQKATMNREVSLTGWADGNAIADSHPETPSQFAIANECLEKLLDGQPEHYRRVIAMKAKGVSNAEIAAVVNLNEGTIRRVLANASRRAMTR